MIENLCFCSVRLQPFCCHRTCTAQLMMKDDFKLGRQKFLSELNEKTSDRNKFVFGVLKRAYEEDWFPRKDMVEICLSNISIETYFNVAVLYLFSSLSVCHWAPSHKASARSPNKVGLAVGPIEGGLFLERTCVSMLSERWRAFPRKWCSNTWFLFFVLQPTNGFLFFSSKGCVILGIDGEVVYQLSGSTFQQPASQEGHQSRSQGASTWRALWKTNAGFTSARPLQGIL